MDAIPMNLTSLFKQKNKLEAEIEIVESCISALQQICTHEYIYSGNNHNDDIFECEHCKHVQYR